MLVDGPARERRPSLTSSPRARTLIVPDEEAEMRAMTCDCGTTLTAESDEELVAQAREHVDADHPDMGASDEMLRGLVASKAHDA